MDQQGPEFSDSRDPLFFDSRDPMVILTDSRDSRDPNRVPKIP